MRTLTKILLTTALALGVSSSASALISVTLSQHASSTYSASLGASNGDILVLAVGYSITGASSALLIDPLIDLGGVGTFTGAFVETGTSNWGTSSSGSSSYTFGTLVNGDVGVVASNGGIDGLDRASSNATGVGAADGCWFIGARCSNIGRITIELNGTGGVIDTGSLLQPLQFGTLISDGNLGDVTDSSFLGTFTVIPVPEPTTASLLGLGLLGLTLAGRSRKN